MTYDTDSLLQSVIRDCEGQAREEGFDLHYDDDESYQVQGVTYLQDAVTNAVRNGIEHSGGDNIWLSSEPADDAEDMIEIYVDDDGHGIPWSDLGLGGGTASERRKLFELGVGNNTGIGLHLVAKAAEQSQGYVDAGSSPRSRGTRITIGLPRLDEEE